MVALAKLWVIELWVVASIPPVVAAEATSSGTLTVLASLAGSALVVAAFERRARNRGTNRTPGEGPSAAAGDVAEAAATMARSVGVVVGPLERANIELTGRIAELQSLLAQTKHDMADALIKASEAQNDVVKVQAQAMTERHDLAEQLAIVRAQYARVVAELDTYKVKAGHMADRRDEADRRDTDDIPE